MIMATRSISEQCSQRLPGSASRDTEPAHGGAHHGRSRSASASHHEPTLKPAVWLSTRRRVISPRAGRSFGARFRSNPVSTRGWFNAGMTVRSGSSRPRTPESTSCSPATAMIGRTNADTWKMVSGVIRLELTVERAPKAPT